jgi:hypothetical protein
MTDSPWAEVKSGRALRASIGAVWIRTALAGGGARSQQATLLREFYEKRSNVAFKV